MAEGSGSKVAIGCCSGIAIVVCAALMISVIWGKKAWTFLQTAAGEHSAFMEIVEEWETSLDEASAAPQSLSPESVGNFQRKEQVLNAGAPGFSLGATGSLDVYRSGDDEISVWIVETSQIEMAAAIEKVKAQIDSRFSRKSKTSFFVNGSGRLSYSGSPPDEEGLMMNTDARIFLIQSNVKPTDLGSFFKIYLEAGVAAAAESGEIGASATIGAEGTHPAAESSGETRAEPE